MKFRVVAIFIIILVIITRFFLVTTPSNLSVENNKTQEVQIEKVSISHKILSARVDKILYDSSYGQKNLFRAVILGEKEPVYKKIKNLFTKTGTSHLLAISGLHMGIILFLLTFILTKCHVPKRERNIAILILITFYFLGIRSSPSVQRAYIMTVIFLVGNIFYQNYNLKKALLISFFISLIINPLVYKSISFVLTYSAMVGIILINYLLKFTDRKMKNISENKYILMITNYFIFTFSLQLFMAPFIYFYFGTFAFKTILFSAILTPIGSIYIFSAFLSLILPLMPLTNLFYDILIKSMEFLV